MASRPCCLRQKSLRRWPKLIPSQSFCQSARGGPAHPPLSNSTYRDHSRQATRKLHSSSVLSHHEPLGFTPLSRTHSLIKPIINCSPLQRLRFVSSRSLVTSTTHGHEERTIPAWFVRGGTSNGLVIHRDHLPPQDQWHTVLPQAMGSPDQYGRQLNGMGSGISSTSKIMILSPTTHPDADVDYTFVQVGIKDGSLDMAGNCGNMSSVVGPVAWDWGMVQDAESQRQGHSSIGPQLVSVRLHNTNTSKVIVSQFEVSGRTSTFHSDGDYKLDGVPGSGSKITMSFMNPAGAKTGKSLPSGNPIDMLQLPGGETVRASLIDVSNPGVFVSAQELGLGEGFLEPANVEADDKLKRRLEQIRRAGATAMGLDPDTESIPKVVMLHPAGTVPGVSIRCLAMSMGQAHKAVPLTLALCLGAAAQIPGTLASELATARADSESTITIGHPSGKLEIGTTHQDGALVSAELLRTARYLMKGEVCY